MKNIFSYSTEVYLAHLPLILVFSLSFIIAFAIPIFASFPTYNDIGAIFLRLTSILTNLTPFTTGVIVFSTLLSLLFLSFAIVAINVIVKHSRTQTRIKKEVMDGLERFTGNVFFVLLIYTIIVLFFAFFDFIYNIPQFVTSIIALVITPLFFYAPAAIVIDEKGTIPAMRMSAKFFFKRFDYVLIWLILAIVLLTIFDFIFIMVGGTTYSRYLLLIVNSLFIMPYLVVLQSQSYISRFSLLKR